MKITCYYNRNLKMSEGKVAAQIGHLCKELGKTIFFEYGLKNMPCPSEDVIVVLGLRQNPFNKELEIAKESEKWLEIQEDLGLTEVDKGTVTCFGYLEE
jgi:peptidyl-tRNA hydrolase